MKPDTASLAGSIANLFVTSKLTLLFILACALLGSLALAQMPRADNPQIVVPAVEVQVQLPGASPAEVEALVVRPLEIAIQQIDGVDNVYATALDSLALLTVQFKVGENEETSLVKLHDRIEAQRAALPLEAGVPLVRSLNVDDVPIVTVTLASAQYDDYALKRLADRLLDGLRSLEAVSTLTVKGGRDRELRIELNPDHLQAYGVTLDQVRDRLAAANVAAPLGRIVQGDQSQPLLFKGFVGSAEELRRLMVGQHGQRLIYLGDVADVIDGPPVERTTLSRFAFGPADPRFGTTTDVEWPAVTLAIGKKRGTNSVEVAEQVLARIAKLQAQFIPAGVDVVITRDDGRKANVTVNGLIEHLGIAVLAVFLVTLAFLGWKEAAIVGFSVPLVLALTLGIAWLSGQTINRVSLFGLILSLGLLVDDAIVVVENIHRRYLRGDAAKRSATVEAAHEVGNPTNLATLAVMLVFSSLLVITDMPGEYFFPIAFTVPVAMAASLLVAYSIVPWASHRWLRMAPAVATSSAISSATHAHESALSRGYRRLLAPLLDHSRQRKRAFLLIFLLLLLSLFQPAWQFFRPSGLSGPQAWFGVEMSMMPKDDKNTFNITVDLPEMAALERTDQLVRQIGEVLRAHPQVKDYQVWLGESGVIDFNSMLRGASNKKAAYVAEIRVNLRDKAERSVTSMDVVRELRPLLMQKAQAFPGSTLQLVEDPPGPPVNATVMAELYGTDQAALHALSAQVKNEFSQTWDMVEVSQTTPADVPQYQLWVDREKAALSGLASAEIAATLRRAFDGEYLGRAHLDAEKNPVPIRLLIPRRHQLDITQLSRIFVTNAQGQRVPLSELVKVQPSLAERPIQRKNGERVTFVGGEMGASAPLYAVLDLDRRLDQKPLPDGNRLTTTNLRLQPVRADSSDGYTLLWGGEIRQMLTTYRDMIGALALSIGLIFLILVAYYQSFRLPLVAMAAIPLGLVGIFPGHWLAGQTFSATSLVGVIALAGVVVRNSLLIIDFVLVYRSQGVPLRDALLEAGAVRLRPIMLTALAIMLGSAVMVTDPLFVGLALSLIFGTLSATVLTLIVIPVLLLVLLRKSG